MTVSPCMTSASVTLPAFTLVTLKVTGPAGTESGDGAQPASVSSIRTVVPPAAALSSLLPQPATTSPVRARAVAHRTDRRMTKQLLAMRMKSVRDQETVEEAALTRSVAGAGLGRRRPRGQATKTSMGTA